MIGAFIESLYVAGEGNLGKGYLEEGCTMLQRWVQSECRLQTSNFLRGME